MAPAAPYEQKLAVILRLEDQRILRVDPPPADPAAVPARVRTAKPPTPPEMPDLTRWLGDTDARVRRRAALAIGRVGLRDGTAPLTAALSDDDPEVRQMAAFALGLIGDPSAAAALTQALADPAVIVRGRAAEALGQIGAKESAAAIGKVAAEYVRAPAVAAMSPDDQTWPAAPEAEAFKLAIFALVRLGAYEPLAAAVLEGDRPLSRWWPIAFALQRINDPRAVPALTQLASGPGVYTTAFAARGLGGSKNPGVVTTLLPLLDAKRPIEVQVAAIRAVAQLNASAAGGALTRLLETPQLDPNVRLEAVSAAGTLRLESALPVVQDLMTDRWPAMRIAATRAAAAIDPELFLIVLASLDRDADWTVRAGLAPVMATLPREIALERVRELVSDEDKRTWPAALRALARLAPEEMPPLLFERLKEPDFAVRATVSDLLGELKPPGGAEALREAYRTGLADATYAARAAALSALAEYGLSEARETLTSALGDKDWAVRVRAAELLARLEPGSDHQKTIRPAPAAGGYDDPALLSPEYSPHVFIDTAKGTIEFELAVLDAPLTSRNFIALARKGFFNGLPIHRVVPNFVVQDGDPRGDGQGGPGYTIRDELNERPFLRGTVGMALSWKDTGGSQFFITHSPQPHLDARYTAFGHVVSGMEVVDRIQQGDVIQRIRVWDGRAWQ
ncbi:MAG TPA: HEAT repeat domain-containing protein [Vicinamibacterales bacterium]|nr:HEAT repeat domain-containing protein [Vicinamibacterales bacterium]